MAIDIPTLWNQFIEENITAKIIDKLSSEIYCVYRDYDSDETAPYTVFLGHPIPVDSDIQDELQTTLIEPGDYQKFTAKGNLQEGAVYQAWQQIWQSKTVRKYTTDFEVYGAKASDITKAEVDIYIAI